MIIGGNVGGGVEGSIKDCLWDIVCKLKWQLLSIPLNGTRSARGDCLYKTKKELFSVVKKQNNEALEFLDVINNQSRIYI